MQLYLSSALQHGCRVPTAALVADHVAPAPAPRLRAVRVAQQRVGARPGDDDDPT